MNRVKYFFEFDKKKNMKDTIYIIVEILTDYNVVLSLNDYNESHKDNPL